MPSPWEPTTNTLQLAVLGKFVEELTECASASARCIIQGLECSEPVTGKPNREWISEELADVLATMNHVIDLFDLDRESIYDRAASKYLFLEEWHDNLKDEND